MWLGPFNNEVSSMAIFEATEAEAKEFFKKYEDDCSEVLTSHLYSMGCDANLVCSVIELIGRSNVFWMMNMKDELCRICECRIEEFEKCPKCHLFVATICKCCQTIKHTQTHIHW